MESDSVVLFVFPLLVALSVPALRKQAAREGDARLFWFLLVALLLKLVVGTYIRYYNTVIVNGGTDSNAYHQAGVDFFASFRHLDFTTDLESLTGTNFIRFLTGLVYAFIGPSQPGGFLVYSWLAFWGLFLFYRAFVIAVPEGNKRSYARLLFLLPTHLFWPSSMGKEAWMVLAVGISALGIAQLLTGKTVRGLATASIGIWLAALVRPHEAAMILLALGAAYVFRRPQKHAGELALLGKVLMLGVLVGAGSILAAQTEAFLEGHKVDLDQGVTTALQTVSKKSEGGSTFVPTIVSSPWDLPEGTLTVLFRPFFFEAHTTRAFFSGVEAAFLLALSIKRIPGILSAVRSFRRQPYVAAAGAFTLMFIVGFSSFSNFGNLVRQRSVLYPLFLVLLTARRPRPVQAQEHNEATDQQPAPPLSTYSGELVRCE